MKINFAQIRLFILGISFCAVFLPATALSYDYSIDVPYPEAVTEFLKAVEDAVKDVPNKEEVRFWAQDVSQRLPEFLGDMVAVSRKMSEQSFLDNNLKPFYDFEQKWSMVLDSCPDCEQFIPLLAPLFKDLVKDLPGLPPIQAGDPPFARMAGYYQEMEQLNPWGLGAFFNLFFQEEKDRGLQVREITRERRDGEFGLRTYVLSRITIQKINGKTVFYENIRNDRLDQVAYSQDPITLLHQAWEQLVNDVGDTQSVRFWGEMIRILDRELVMARHSELFDDFTYYYLYNQSPITNEMVYARHPLMNPQYNGDYKIAEFYPRQYFNPKCYQPENCGQIDYVGFQYPQDSAN